MAIQHGIPGEWARVRGTVLSLWPLFLACALAGALATALLLGCAVLVCAALFFASRHALHLDGALLKPLSA